MKKLFSGLLFIAASALAVGATTTPIQLLNPSGSSAGQAIVSTGASSAPAWGGVGVNGIAAVSANTVLANATSSNASPTAFAMPSCSTSASALTWTTSSGFTCNTAINAATLGGASFAAPGSIGSTTPGSGAFTSLSASGAVSGAGFINYLASPPAIGGTISAAGSFTTLSASSTVSGTGFSNYLASPPAIGTTTAAAGKFTTLQATSTITPSTTSGIVGTTAADSANAGSVGEVISTSVASGSAVSLTSSSPANVMSVSLTAGDWDCSTTISLSPSVGMNVLAAWTSTSSATLPVANTNGGLTYLSATSAIYGTMTVPVNRARYNVSSTTTLYASAQATFSGTVVAYGYEYCRRVR